MKWLFVYCFVLSSFLSQAATETTVSYINGQDFLEYAINNSAGVADQNALSTIPNFFPTGNPSWQNGYVISKAKGRIELYIDGSALPLFFKYALEVPVTITQYDASGVMTTVNHTFRVDYDPVEGTHFRQLDMWQLDNVYAIRAMITLNNPNIKFISDTPLSTGQKEEISKVVKIRVTEEYDKIVNFDHNYAIKWNEMYFDHDVAKNQVQVSWKVLDGAEVYDLEWGFIERYDQGLAFTTLPLTTATHDFNANSTRVTIATNSYTLPLVYESGALVFRVRGRGKVLPDIEHTVNGAWSCGKWAGNCNNDYSQVSPNFNNWHHRKWFLDAHENDNKNWQVVTSYAEEGKRKDVVTYFDGTMRTRQTVTVSNSDQNAIVAETMYDHQGRAAVQILPAPVLHDPALKYRANFNRNLANQPFSKLDFDLDATVPCSGMISQLNSISGAAFYYSPQFYMNLTQDEQSTHLAYIPDSKGYPMIQTEYTPDNTGRILRQGGAGATFQLESGHETKYLYGTPAQEELDYLFGTNVGQASHYKKNVVIDPNGQASVSYLDAKGNTIATALSGEAPDGLAQLDSYHPIPMTINLLAFNRVDTIEYSIDATFTLLVEKKADHQFYYGVTAEQFTVPGCTPSNVCYDCVYDLELLVVSNECPDTLYRFTRTIGQFFTNPPGSSTSQGGSGSARLVGSALNPAYGLSTDCGVPQHFNTGMLPQNNAFTVPDMPIGSYSIIKRLKVNQDAAQAYLEHYINDPNNVCTNVLEDMLNEQLDLVDTDDCNLDCDDVDPNDPADDELEEMVCDTMLSNPCEIAYERMLADFYPGGQYAEFETDFYLCWNKTLSIFNPYSHLVMYNDAAINWGTIQVENNAGVMVSPNLLTTKEYIQNFEPEWAEKFITFHPEYCMLNRCRDSLVASYEFNNQLTETNTFSEAIAANYISNSGFVSPYNILSQDPYFSINNPGEDSIGRMQLYMEHFQHGNAGQHSIWDIAIATAFCNGNINDLGCMTAVDMTFLSDPINSQGANYMWAVYKSLYITLKERIEYKKRSSFAMNFGNCYNECIGQDAFNPYINDFLIKEEVSGGFGGSPIYNYSGEFYDNDEPCRIYRYYAFKDKVKVFPSPYDMLPNMDVDFWDAPMSDLYNNVAPSIPDYPCDTCDCKTQLNALLNVLLMDEVADKMAQANTSDDYATELNNLDIPIQNLQLAFNQITIPGVAGQNVNFYKDQAGQIIIVFGNMPVDDGCTIRTNVTVKELLPIDSISIDKCPTPSPIAIHDMVIAVSFYSNGSLVMTKNFRLSGSCTFKCKPENTSSQKCEALPIVNDLLAFINSLHHVQNVKDNFTNPTLQTVSYNEVSMGSVLLDSIVNLGFIAQDNTPLTSHTLSNEVVLTFGNIRCLIHLNLGNNNQHFGGPFITHFSDLVPDYSQANALGYTSSFTIVVHFANGTSMNATGKFAESNHVACIPIGRCCIEEKPNGRITSNTQGKPRDNKSVIPKTNTRKNKSQSKPNTSSDLTKGPKPLPSSPRPPDPPKPFDPLCDDCITLNLSGTLLDGIKPPCPPNWCDTSLWSTIELDSIPNTCVEHLYDVAAANAYMLYDAFIDSVSIAFLHAYNMKCLKAVEDMRDESGFTQHHFTLYYYDQSNNLVQTVPPNGVQGLDVTEMAAMATYRENIRTHVNPNPLPTVSSIDAKLTSNYTLNSLNQITTQKIPDQGIYDVANSVFIKESTVFWYDHLGRLICSQNPEQRTKKEYTYTIYDDLGRIREVGAVNSNIPPPFSPIDTKDDANWISFIANNKSQITTTTYDVDFYNGSLPPLFPIPAVENLRGRVSAAAVYDTQLAYDQGKPEYITHYSYDIHGNVKALVQDGKNTPQKLIEYDFDLISGKVNEVHYQRNKNDQYIHRYQYDADNRLTMVYTSANGIHWDEDAHYMYYPHGPLARTEIGEDEIQGIDYAYTLQGWIKGVNSAYLRTHTDMGHDGLKASEHKYFGQDVVGYVLNYFDGDYDNIGQSGPADRFDSKMAGSYALQPQENLYNGNIRAMITAIRPFMQAGSPAGYKYQYDQLHRIKGMDYYTGMNINNWSSASVSTDYQTRYSYDANGNILSLSRHGAASIQTAMDDMSYHYDQANNRLTHVNDAIPATSVYTTDIENQNSNNYQYDRNGNLIRDVAEGLSIKWNLSGKVSQIIKDNGTIITFRYDALGNRIIKSHNDTLTWYVRDASGNAMATYANSGPPIGTAGSHGPVMTRAWQIESWTMYGSARLGEFSPIVSDPRLTPSDSDNSGGQARLARPIRPTMLQHYRGRKQYELTNHLGNVLAIVSDRKRLAKAALTDMGLYAHIITATDYYPEGMQMPNRIYHSEKYQYKHQGQISDAEIYGEGNAYFYKYRMSDSRLGRFWSVDPLHQKYAYNSNYAFSENRLIDGIELEGMEVLHLNSMDDENDPSHPNYNSSGYKGRVFNYPDDDDFRRDKIIYYRDYMNATIEDMFFSWTHSVNQAIIDLRDDEVSIQSKTTSALSATINVLFTFSKGPNKTTITNKYMNNPSKTKFVDLNRNVSIAETNQGSKLYQYRKKMHDGKENPTAGNYFVRSKNITPEQVGLLGKDYELYEVTVGNKAKVHISYHEKKTKYWADNKTDVIGGGEQIYSNEIKVTDYIRLQK